ncbi:MAG TPA: enoyl-CoA hydratase/isomerase family protein [Trebonia sp.]|jgi:enoyl-CoA hydratase|nr:enoyl-CoA hydratase/isomerase family protein [Trebonia sp.]
MIETEDRSGVTVLRLKHGKVNALDTELLRAITDAMRNLDPAAAVVITGHGSAFSAGVDLKRIVDGGQAYVREFLPALSEMFLAVFEHQGPAVAAVNGHAIAGGCVLAAACDVRLMSGGRIGLAELSVGVPFPTVALEIMRHAIGPAAGNLVLTARLLHPAQAQAIGLVHDVEAPDELLDAAVAVAATMAKTPADVYSMSKRQLQLPARAAMDGHDAEEEAVEASWSASGTRHAIAGYLAALGQRGSAR